MTATSICAPDADHSPVIGVLPGGSTAWRTLGTWSGVAAPPISDAGVTAFVSLFALCIVFCVARDYFKIHRRKAAMAVVVRYLNVGTHLEWAHHRGVDLAARSCRRVAAKLGRSHDSSSSLAHPLSGIVVLLFAGVGLLHLVGEGGSERIEAPAEWAWAKHKNLTLAAAKRQKPTGAITWCARCGLVGQVSCVLPDSRGGFVLVVGTGLGLAWPDSVVCDLASAHAAPPALHGRGDAHEAAPKTRSRMELT